MNRNKNLQSLEGEKFDVVVIGGGITGAPIYHELCKRGYRVAIVDRGDFACGTSSASGMLIWGGLLYLKQLDLLTVRTLSKARDELILSFPQDILCKALQYFPAPQGMRSWFVMLVLYLYWMMGSRQRKLPSRIKQKQDLQLIYEEAMLRQSDSRFVWQWIAGLENDNCIPVNYCEFVSGDYESRNKVWNLQLCDVPSGRDLVVKSTFVINCAGVWTDRLNEKLGLDTPYQHVMSKGVYINLRRKPEDTIARVFELDHGDVITHVPWGAVSMWGCTETPLKSIEAGFSADVEDIRDLLGTANRYLERNIGVEDIVSIRSGVRPLAVKKGAKWKKNSFELSRKHVIADDLDRNAFAVYGGKLTSSAILAKQMAKRLVTRLKPRFNKLTPVSHQPEYDFSLHNDKEVRPQWAREYELCMNLEDYLRRRTNISQWVPRMGLGDKDENVMVLHRICVELHPSKALAKQDLDQYINKVRVEHDALLKKV